MNQKEIWDSRYLKKNDFPTEKVWIESFMEYISENKENTIIDLGCRKGDNAINLFKKGYNVFACDFSSVAIDTLHNEYPILKIRCLDMINEFPNDIQKVGVIFASLSTHYFSLDDTVSLYANIYNLLLPGGYFILRVNSKEEFERNNRHDVVSMLEEDYYLINDGTTKRYFDIEDITNLLNDFIIIKLNVKSEIYFKKEKHYIEVVAQKM